MEKKQLLVPLYLKNGQAVCGIEDHELVVDGDACALALQYSNCGADGILLFDLSEDDDEHDQSISVIKTIASLVDIPVYGGGNICRTEDVKKLIYAGCRRVFLNFAKMENRLLAQEVSERFGRERILASVTSGEVADILEYRQFLGGLILLDAQVPVQEGQEEELLAVLCWKQDDDFFVILNLEEYQENTVKRCLGQSFVSGVSCTELMGNSDFMAQKHALKDAGVPVNTYESSLSWDEIKTDASGLLPVVVQDYKTQEVLMVAYMNRESYEMTVRTGRMTYWSRSRSELWVKGLTSGHFQYVRELCIDCDNDTLLAKVMQVGAACHTGNRSCFYRSILKKEYDETNPLKVFEDVYNVILDRKEHPKTGSYTNYLFDKGIDKILKKVGEEATEIVIAAKNPDPEEVKYEISDFLYHVMVLMAEKGINWEDITRELARR
jgi:phosphoribosyl-ATP pyrophosphohydrolase/phosphoribosyl-AMP cyclohydrolase